MLALAFEAGRNLDPLSRLAMHYQDRHPDFADLCVIRMSELYPKHAVVTTDIADFRLYRRRQRESIPLLCPPFLVAQRVVHEDNGIEGQRHARRRRIGVDPSANPVER